MTVAELIEGLKEFPQDSEVMLMSDPEGNDVYAIDELGKLWKSNGQSDSIAIWPKHITD